MRKINSEIATYKTIQVKWKVCDIDELQESKSDHGTAVLQFHIRCNRVKTLDEVNYFLSGYILDKKEQKTGNIDKDLLRQKSVSTSKLKHKTSLVCAQ